MKLKLIQLQGKVSNRSNPLHNDDGTTDNEVGCCDICHCTMMDVNYNSCNLCRETSKFGGYSNVKISDDVPETWLTKDEDGEITESCTTHESVTSCLCDECGDREDECGCGNCISCGLNECECEFCDECGYRKDDGCGCDFCDNCGEVGCETCVRCVICYGYECDSKQCEYCRQFIINCDGYIINDNECNCKCGDITVP